MLCDESYKLEAIQYCDYNVSKRSFGKKNLLKYNWELCGYSETDSTLLDRIFPDNHPAHWFIFVVDTLAFYDPQSKEPYS